ncbi:putative nuclease HARBI1 [Rhizophagus clarus]|uniref:Putative nuclease HARBI1 n=1 Tax=Rhizophagus clarus TaxID=94130 RepID=A0A8H3LUV6_9GLOM|nr:putative nuclease HARBI1 [Rhizophagus clarus]
MVLKEVFNEQPVFIRLCEVMCDVAERKSKNMGKQNIKYSDEFTSFLLIDTIGYDGSVAAMTDNTKLKERLQYSPILGCIIGSVLSKEETIVNVYGDISNIIKLLIASYSIEQEEEDFNILPLILLYSQHNKEINELRKLNRLISNYWFNEVCLNMQDFEFKKHFRLTRSTFEWLCCEIIPLLRRNSNEPGRSIGEKFGTEKSIISYALRQFFDVIISKFLSEKIIIPTTELKVNRITNRFKITRNFPNVIGAIDGSHILIKAPHLFPVDYFNRKGFYSIVLQAVVDHKRKFLDICVGWPGSTHDSRILINSNLYNKFNNQVTTHLNNKYILGDGRYPNLSWLIVPYKDIGRGLTQEQTYFNRKHSQTRIKVKQAFGLLKGRW